ncbi:hypothetical protein AgCh_025878 [Apium graveolens]
MEKKGSSSSRRAFQTPEKNVVVGKDKSYYTTQKPVGEGKAKDPETFGSEIDEIFSSKKRKKPETGEEVAEKKAALSVTKKKKNSHAKSKPTKDIKGPLDMPAVQRKRTKDGLVVYTEEELGFGKSDAGGGPLDMLAGQRKRTRDGLVVYTEIHRYNVYPNTVDVKNEYPVKAGRIDFSDSETVDPHEKEFSINITK